MYINYKCLIYWIFAKTTAQLLIKFGPHQDLNRNCLSIFSGTASVTLLVKSGNVRVDYSMVKFALPYFSYANKEKRLVSFLFWPPDNNVACQTALERAPQNSKWQKTFVKEFVVQSGVTILMWMTQHCKCCRTKSLQ